MSKEELEESLPKIKDDAQLEEDKSNESTPQASNKVNVAATETQSINEVKVDENNNNNNLVNDTKSNNKNGDNSNKFKEIIQVLTNKFKEIKGNKNALIIGIVLIVLVLLLIVRGAVSSPKNIYKGIINDSYKEVHSYLKKADKLYKKYDLEKNAVNAKASLKLDTTMDLLKDYSGYKYELNGGLDLQNKIANATVTVQGDKDNVDGTITIVKDKAYFTSTLFKQIINITEEMNIDEDYFTKITKELEENNIDFNADDYDYIVKTVKDVLIKNLNSKYMKKTSGSFELDDKTIKASKITYTLDDDSVKELVKGICEELLKNDKFLKKIADIADIDKSDVKDAIKNLKAAAKDIDLDDDIEFNIFTKGILNKVIGFNISMDDDEYISLYNYQKKFEFIYDDHSDNKLVVTGIKNKKETEVTIKYNKEKIATLNVREFSDNKIDFDFNINYDDEAMNGSIYLTIVNKKDVYSGEYKVSFKQDKESLSVSGDYSYEIGGELKAIDTKKAVTLEDVDYDEIEKAIDEKLKNDEKLNKIATSLLNNIKEESLDLNYYGMIDISTDEEALEVLSKQKATVLYIGSTYYYDDNKNNVFSLLRDAQDSLDFYSYLYRKNSLSDELSEKLKDVESSCETVRTVVNYDEITTNNETNSEENVCSEAPVIYLIKDGKALKALRGTITKEQLIEALKEIGIE